MKNILPEKLDHETLGVFLSWIVEVLTGVEDKIALTKRKWELFTQGDILAPRNPI